MDHMWTMTTLEITTIPFIMQGGGGVMKIVLLADIRNHKDNVGFPLLRDRMYRANMYRYAFCPGPIAGPKGITGQNVSPINIRRLNGYCYHPICYEV